MKNKSNKTNKRKHQSTIKHYTIGTTNQRFPLNNLDPKKNPLRNKTKPKKSTNINPQNNQVQRKPMQQ